MTPEPTPTVSQLLAFYLEAGVDCALSDEPVDRLAEPEAPAAVRAAPPSNDASPARAVRTPPAAFVTPTSEPMPAPDAAIASAREAARSAASLEILRDMLEKFDGCALKSTATRLVFADGNPKARIMFVGEAPGRDEDIEGLPFVGRSGKLLDRMIAAIGLDRTKVYIANVIPWRPPGNRTPTPQETQICLPFIQRQIELVDPDILVTLGNPSTQTLLSTREGIMKTRGRWFNYDTGTRAIRAMATFHPAYLLRSPSYKRLSWQDLRAIAKALPADHILAVTAPSAARSPSRSAARAAARSRCRSKVCGTSGAMPGNSFAISDGGLPSVSEARQTTTPPVWLNLSRLSHGVRSGVVARKRCGRVGLRLISVANCASPLTAARCRLVRRSKLSSKKCPIAAVGSDVITSPLAVQGTNSVAAMTPIAGARITAAHTVRNIC